MEVQTVAEQPNGAMTPQQVARYIGVSDAALRLWRSRGEGPPFFKAGPRLVRYRRTDIDAWIESRLSEGEDSRTRPQQLEIS